MPWYNNRTNIKSVKVEGKISQISTAYWFYELTNCTNLEVEKLDTSNVTDMHAMFQEAGYTATYSLNLSGWNVTKVTSYTNFNWRSESKVIPPKFGQ